MFKRNFNRRPSWEITRTCALAPLVSYPATAPTAATRFPLRVTAFEKCSSNKWTVASDSPAVNVAPYDVVESQTSSWVTLNVTSRADEVSPVLVRVNTRLPRPATYSSRLASIDISGSI